MFGRYINQLPLESVQLGTWPTTQARALTENRTGDHSDHRTIPNQLSHTSQGSSWIFRDC